MKRYEREMVKDGILYLREVENQLNYVAIDTKTNKVIRAKIDGRNYKAERYLKKFEYLTHNVNNYLRQSIKVSPRDIVTSIIEGGRI